MLIAFPLHNLFSAWLCAGSVGSSGIPRSQPRGTQRFHPLCPSPVQVPALLRCELLSLRPPCARGKRDHQQSLDNSVSKCSCAFSCEASHSFYCSLCSRGAQRRIKGWNLNANIPDCEKFHTRQDQSFAVSYSSTAYPDRREHVASGALQRAQISLPCCISSAPLALGRIQSRDEGVHLQIKYLLLLLTDRLCARLLPAALKLPTKGWQCRLLEQPPSPQIWGFLLLSVH